MTTNTQLHQSNPENDNWILIVVIRRDKYTHT